MELDVAGKYWMFWTPDDETETITFEVNLPDILNFTKPNVWTLRKNRYILFLFLLLQVHVEALGYVGFGVSPNGGMTGADVVIGWVSDIDGTAVFHVRMELNYIKERSS